MQIKYGSVFGNYRWDATADVSKEQLALLAPLGALQIAQRSPSTAAEKAMAGYEKRPAGFKRTAIPFTDEGAAKLSENLSKLVIETGEEDEKGKAVTVEIPATVTVTEYVPEDRDGGKFTSERAKYVQRKDNLGKLATAVGYDGDLGDGTADGAPEAFLRAIRTWVRAQADAL